MRQILIWSVSILLLFIVFIGLAFVGLTYLTPAGDEIQAPQNIAVDESEELDESQELDGSQEPDEALDMDIYSDSLSYDDSRPVEKKKPKARALSKADSLSKVIDKLSSDLFFTNLALDSLTEQITLKDGLIENYLNQVEALEKDLLTRNDKSSNIKDLAKTYETMKVAEIKPILERVDDETIMALYKNMGTRTRKIILQALSGPRAAQITEKLAG